MESGDTQLESSLVGTGNVTAISDSDKRDLVDVEYPRGQTLAELPRHYITSYDEYKDVLNTCNHTIHTNSYPTDGGTYCNATWDTMQCWGYTAAGTTVYQPCPAYIDLSNPMAFSRKTCNVDGTWFTHPESHQVWTNYSMCYDDKLVEAQKRVLHMYTYGFSISIVMCVLSLIIFSCFRQLKCVRVTLHKNLFISYVLTGMMWILYYRLVPMDSQVLLENPLWCKVLHVLTQYMTVCNYAWMFCEGFYLNALIVITFTKDKKLLYICYVIGWVVPILPAIIYTCIRASDSDEDIRCWTFGSDLNWIFAGPINASLIVNLIFAVNIMRILLSKLRSVQTNETMQTRRAVRATLILIPLLGLQYIALPFKPPEHGTKSEYIYSMVSAFLVSFQGVFVSLMFCFFNGEVIAVLRKYIPRCSASIRGRTLMYAPHGGRRKSSTMTFTLPEYSMAHKSSCKKSPSQTQSLPNGGEERDLEMVSMPLTGGHSHDEEEGDNREKQNNQLI